MCAWAAGLKSGCGRWRLAARIGRTMSHVTSCCAVGAAPKIRPNLRSSSGFAANEPVPQKHLLRLLERENPHFCGFSLCFLMGRPGLEPGTLCLKDSGRLVYFVSFFHSVYFTELFRARPSIAATVSTKCKRLSPTFVLLTALFGEAAFAELTVQYPMICGL